jgi:hypothetical protein
MLKIITIILPLICASNVFATENWNANKLASPVLTPTQAWEGTATYEPRVLMRPTSCVLVAAPCIGIWYTGGWGTVNCFIGYAESPINSTGAGGVTWTKHTGPILGSGAGGVSGTACHKNVEQAADGSYRIYFPSSATAPSDMMVVSSPDGVTGFSTPTIAIAHDQWMQWSCCGNVVQLNGAWYYILGTGSNGVYQVTFAVGPTFDGPWYKALPYAYSPFPAPFAGTNGDFTPGQLYQVGTGFQTWAFGAPHGNAPSYLYHACSTVLWLWSVANGGNPVMTITMPWEGDQVADASMMPMRIQVGGTWYDYVYLYYDGVNNATGTASIGVSWYQGTMASLSCP